MLTVYKCGHIYNENTPQNGETLDILRGRQFIAPDKDCPACEFWHFQDKGGANAKS